MWNGLAAIAEQLKRFVSQFTRLVDVAQQFLEQYKLEVAAIQTIAKELHSGPGNAVAVEVYLQTGATMSPQNKAVGTPTMIVDSATNRIFVFGTDSLGALGAQLAAGDSVAVTIDNAAVASILADASPLASSVASADGKVPVGTPSVYSGVVSPVTPIQTGVAFNAVVVASIAAEGGAQAAIDYELQWQPGAATGVLVENE